MRSFFYLLLLGVFLITAALAYQRGGFRRYLDEEDNPARMPADAGEKTEYQFARLRYPSGRYGGYWGYGAWGTDFPKADPAQAHRSFITLAAARAIAARATAKAA